MSIRSCSPLSPSLEESNSERKSPTFSTLTSPMEAHLPYLSQLESGSNKPITYTFAHQLRGLVYYHIEESTSAAGLLCSAKHDAFVNKLLVPQSGLGKSTFYEANATRGSIQMTQLLDRLYKKASRCAGISYAQLGQLVAIDGSLIAACLSMTWADYRKKVRKAKMHLGFDLNQNIPRKMALTDGKGAERPFVTQLLNRGETGVLDRGYQDHGRFDDWVGEGKHFVARLKNNTQYDILESLSFQKKGAVFFFAKVLLSNDNQKMVHPIFLVKFKSRNKTYLIATDREDLTAEQIAFIFSLRWQIETFFSWWKRHLDIYHLISRNPHGVLVQLLAGLITYLLLVIYFHQRYAQPPSLERLRLLRLNIRQESAAVHIHHYHLYFVVIPLDLQLLFFTLIYSKQPAIF